MGRHEALHANSCLGFERRPRRVRFDQSTNQDAINTHVIGVLEEDKRSVNVGRDLLRRRYDTALILQGPEKHEFVVGNDGERSA